MAAGLGMPEKDIDNSTLSHVGSFIRGALKRQNDHDLEAWRQTRWLAGVIINYFQPKGKEISATKLLPLPGDEEIKKPAKASKPSDIDAFIAQLK